MIKLRLLVASFERKVSFCSFQIVQTEPTEWNAGLRRMRRQHIM